MAPLCGSAARPTQLVVSEELTHSLRGLAGQAGRAPPCTRGHTPSGTGESGVYATLFPAWSVRVSGPPVVLLTCQGSLPRLYQCSAASLLRPGPWGTGLWFGGCFTSLFFLVPALGT